MEKTVKDRKAAEQELRNATRQAEQAQRSREDLDQQLETVDATLREAKDDHRKSKDEERLLTAIRNLKSHFPGVLGRLVDLCRPAQRRFNLAVTVAAGKDMDAIVVDTRATGIDCIRYLREQRVGTATFLPLDSLQIPSFESAERLRARIASDSRFRLAADVITYDEAIQKAVLYAVGNAVVCDDLNAARQLCFTGGGDTLVKAVTLGGAVISKAGTMTGGVTNEDSNRAGRWDDKVVSDLLKKKAKLQEDRSNLDKDPDNSSGRASFAGGRIEELRNNFQFLNNRADYSKSDMEFTRKQLHEKKTLLKSIEREIPSLEKSLQQAEREISTLSAQNKEAIQAVKQAEDQYLAPFREETGLQDLQAYERAIRESRQEFTRQKRTLMEHLGHLEQQKEYESNRDLKQPINKLEKRISTQKNKLKESKKLEKELESTIKKAKAKLLEAEESLEKASENEQELEEETKALQKDFKDFQTERGKLQKAVTVEETALERLRGKLHETLQKARVEEVELPLLTDDGRRTTRSGRRLGDSDDEYEMEEDEDRLFTQPQSSSSGPTQYSQDNFSSSQNEKVTADNDEASKVDFSKMRNDLKQRLGDREERKVRKEFDDTRLKLEGEIEGMVPNMKVRYSIALWKDDALFGLLHSRILLITFRPPKHSPPSLKNSKILVLTLTRQRRHRPRLQPNSKR
jgi:structural maintenance of chromosome 1